MFSSLSFPVLFFSLLRSLFTMLKHTARLSYHKINSFANAVSADLYILAKTCKDARISFAKLFHFQQNDGKTPRTGKTVLGKAGGA